MAVTVTTRNLLKIQQTNTTAGISGVVNLDFDFSDSLADGTGLDQCDLVYGAKAVALGGSGTNNLDVAGTLSDFYGTTITAVKLKFFYLKNLSTTAGDTITLGNHATAALLLWGAAAHTKTVGPNAVEFMWEPSLAGIAVTATTGDILKILNDSANANTYDIAFGGTSA